MAFLSQSFEVQFIHTATELVELFIFLGFQLVPANLNSVQSAGLFTWSFKCLSDSLNLASTVRSWMPCSSPLSLNLLCKPLGPPGSQQVLWSCKRAKGIVWVLHKVGTEDSQETGFTFKACFYRLHVFSSLLVVVFGTMSPDPESCWFHLFAELICTLVLPVLFVQIHPTKQSGHLVHFWDARCCLCCIQKLTGEALSLQIADWRRNEIFWLKTSTQMNYLQQFFEQASRVLGYEGAPGTKSCYFSKPIFNVWNQITGMWCSK